MSSPSGTTGCAMSPAVQSNIEGKLSVSWDAIYSLESRINSLASRLLPVSTAPAPANDGQAKTHESNDSPIAQAIMGQARHLETLANKLDEISARLEC